MKRLLLIGGSRGLGLGLIQEHLKRGWDVTTTIRSQSGELEDLQADANGRLAVETLDINNAKQLAELKERLNGHRFDLLFLNAGILFGRQMPLEDVGEDDINAIFMTNAISPIHVADALLENVVAGGMIAFMSSILGSIGTNEDGRAQLYRASKAALNSLVRSFRARHAERDMTVLALHPGVVRTAMGGPNAPLDIATSVEGVADVIEKRWGSGGQAFVDYRNEIIPW